ncbi:MAG: sulfurtransferase [Chloroflexi bacterium]|nr:sulfurtransferase [Chloroflexota bacterium]MCH8309856.1 sulfurtransferase [Chloroflexota bacterium]
MPARVAHPESIVETGWVADNLDTENVRLVEVDVDTTAYDQGHIPGAVGWNWTTQLNDQITRDILIKEQMQRLLGETGIGRNTTVVLYGDNNNWFATYAFWQMKIYGHRRVKMMNGGRQKWIDEGRPITTDPPDVPRRVYRASNADTSIRASRDYVIEIASTRNSAELVDVRAPAEYTGELLAPANLPQEGSQRGGHIPGAANIPWASAVNAADGTFKSVEELRAVYGGQGISGDTEVITYCRIGERSSHTWFVLTQILGYNKVRNYDGSWTEYGSMIGAPIEK